MSDVGESSGKQVANYCGICKSETVNNATRGHPEGVCVTIEIANALVSADRHSTLYGDDPGSHCNPRRQLKTIRFARSGRKFREAIREAAELIRTWKSGNGIPIPAYSYLATFHEPVLQFLAAHHGLRSEYDVQNSGMQYSNLSPIPATVTDGNLPPADLYAARSEAQFVYQTEDEEYVEQRQTEEMECDEPLISDDDVGFFNLNVHGDVDVLNDEQNTSEGMEECSNCAQIMYISCEHFYMFCRCCAFFGIWSECT